MVQKTTPQKVHFKPILGPKMDPKMGNLGEGAPRAQPAGALLKTLVFKMAQDGLKKPKITSWEPFWIFRCCLGRPWTPKNLKKNNGFSRFLQMQVFGTLKLLMAILGPSWLLLGRSGPKMGPQMAPNRLKMDHNGELGTQEFPARGL